MNDGASEPQVVGIPFHLRKIVPLTDRAHEMCNACSVKTFDFDVSWFWGERCEG